MGNCIAVQEKVMKTNGEILEYSAPIKVQQLLSDHAGHAVSDQLPAVCHLRPDSNMVSGQLYHLLPSPEFEQKEVEGENQGRSGVVRIKVVILKQELEVMLTKGEVLSVDDLVSISQHQQKKRSVDDNSFDGNCRGGWKPVLSSIPEEEATDEAQNDAFLSVKPLKRGQGNRTFLSSFGNKGFESLL